MATNLSPCNFGTAEHLEWEILIAEMRRTETNMTKSAIAFRYRPAQRDDVVPTIQTAFEPADSTNIIDTGTAPIKAAVVAEITRFITSSVVSTAKTNPSGLERLARVQGPTKQASIIEPSTTTPAPPGLLAALDAILGNHFPASTHLTSSSSKATRIGVYSELEAQSKLPLITCGIFLYHPLRAGSWVASVFQGRLWICEGKYL
jgi:hypothetical protein